MVQYCRRTWQNFWWVWKLDSQGKTSNQHCFTLNHSLFFTFPVTNLFRWQLKMPYDTLCLNHIIHLLWFHQLPVPLWKVRCGSTHPGFLLPTRPSSCHISPAAQSIPYPWQRDLLLSSESCRGWGRETRLVTDRNRICGASFSLTWWEQLGFPVWLVSDPESCNPI